MHGGASLLMKHKGMGNFYKRFVPEFERSLARKVFWKSQAWLSKTVKSITGTSYALENYKMLDIRLVSTKPIELDLFIPSLALAFEYL
jgi:hypothetical protein